MIACHIFKPCFETIKLDLDGLTKGEDTPLQKSSKVFINMDCFVDSDSKKWGEVVLGDQNYIIICINRYQIY